MMEGSYLCWEEMCPPMFCIHCWWNLSVVGPPDIEGWLLSFHSKTVNLSMIQAFVIDKFFLSYTWLQFLGPAEQRLWHPEPACPLQTSPGTSLRRRRYVRRKLLEPACPLQTSSRTSLRGRRYVRRKLLRKWCCGRRRWSRSWAGIQSQGLCCPVRPLMWAWLPELFPGHFWLVSVCGCPGKEFWLWSMMSSSRASPWKPDRPVLPGGGERSPNVVGSVWQSTPYSLTLVEGAAGRHLLSALYPAFTLPLCGGLNEMVSRSSCV